MFLWHFQLILVFCAAPVHYFRTAKATSLFLEVLLQFGLDVLDAFLEWSPIQTDMLASLDMKADNRPIKAS